MDYLAGKGFLTATSDFTTESGRMTYWPNGVMRAINHSNGVTESQSIDEAQRHSSTVPVRILGWRPPVGACMAPTLSGPADTEVGYDGTAALSIATTTDATGTLSYQWYRGTVPDLSAAVGNTGSDFSVSSLRDNTCLLGEVTRACATQTASSNGRTAIVKVPLSKPVNVKAEQQQGGWIQLNWATVSGATSYTISRRDGSGVSPRLSAAPIPPATTILFLSLDMFTASSRTARRSRSYAHRAALP